MENDFTAEAPQLDIILPSFRDPRILEAIASVRAFDDLDTTRILLIDGGSDEVLLQSIRPMLRSHDVLVSEPDRGIFDALNKGLDLVAAPCVGWIGSDDLYSQDVKASEVVAALAQADLFITSLLLVDGARTLRKTHSWPSAVGLASWGLHNPHYATFGRAELLTGERFVIDQLSSDIDYFLRIFARRPHALSTPKVGLIQAAGGYSNAGLGKIMQVNRNAYWAYARNSNPLKALLSVGIKLGYKAVGTIVYRILAREWIGSYPELRTIHRPKAA